MYVCIYVCMYVCMYVRHSKPQYVVKTLEVVLYCWEFVLGPINLRVWYYLNVR